MSSLINALPNWPKLIFDDPTHTYTVDGIVFPSVSGAIKCFHEPFPKDKAAWNKARSLSRSTGRLWTQQMVTDMWDKESGEACDRGTIVHEYGETYRRSYPILGEPSSIQERGVYDFYHWLPDHYEIVSLEQRMYSEAYGYAGTCDIIARNKITGKYLILDWKTNKDLHKTYQKSMFEPFSYLEECPLTKYYLQLSHYCLLLEEAGYEVENMVVIWLKKIYQHTFQLYKCLDFTDELKEYYKS